jgi:hypothetical protein
MVLKLLCRVRCPNAARIAYALRLEAMTEVSNPGNGSLGQSEARPFGVVRTVLAYVFVWSCLVNLPATIFHVGAPDSYEPVLSYAAAHHLQWGRDIVFTYGPLGFLTSDCYWGNFFWPILLWAGAFALAVTVALMLLLSRLPGAIRLAFYAALPLLTVPACLGLGFDPIRILSIAVLGIVCLPGERAGALRLIATGLVLTILSLTKFTYCIYSVCTFIIIAASNRSGSWRNTAILAGSSLLSLLGICLWSGQGMGNILLHITRSAQMAAGYSAAMAIPATGFDSTAGIVLLIFLLGLLLTSWFSSSNWRGRTDRVAVVAAGIFLAWKEGFVRAELHVMVFFVYAFFLAALLPALLGLDLSAEVKRIQSAKILPEPVGNPFFARRVLALSAACILFSLAPVFYNKDFKAAIHNGLVGRNRNTLTAFLRPATYKLELERYLETMRHEADLPEIRALVGGNTVGAMNLDQDVAILNGLNYTPHPVFVSYAAYTPELQRLNSEFFNSQKAPEYLLWHTGSIDGRFPTLDDGEVLLRILKNYTPVTQEKGRLLWKRKSARENSYCLSNERDFSGSLDQWVPIPAEPTWLRIECKQTLFGAVRGLLWRPSELRIEVQLDNGEARSYRLPPGNARSGFVISPFIRADYQLIEAARASGEFPADPTALPKTFGGESARIVAARVRAGNDFAYQHSVRFVMQTIDGIWPIRGVSPVPESKEISRAQ